MPRISLQPSTDGLDLRPLYLFVQIAEAGSFSKAAAVISVGQPELSRAVKRLEARYSVQLLHRNGRGVSLTDAGARLMRHAQEMLRNLVDVEQELKAASEMPAGQVNMGAPPIFGRAPTSRFVRQLYMEHPQISLRIIEGFTSDLVEWFAEGTLDLAVMYNPPSVSTLIAEHLLDDQLYLVGPSSCLKTEVGIEVDFRSIAKLPLVLPPKPHRLRAAVDNAAKLAEFNPNICVEATGTATLIDLVRAQIGYTILPRSLTPEDMFNDSISTWPLRDPEVSPPLYLVTSMRRPLTAATRCVIDAVRTSFSDGKKSM